MVRKWDLPWLLAAEVPSALLLLGNTSLKKGIWNTRVSARVAAPVRWGIHARGPLAASVRGRIQKSTGAAPVR